MRHDAAFGGLTQVSHNLFAVFVSSLLTRVWGLGCGGTEIHIESRWFHSVWTRPQSPVDCCQNMDDDVSDEVRSTSPWCWRPVRLFAFASQWETAADAAVVVVPLFTAGVVLFTNITASALRPRIFALCSCALARRHAILLLRNSSGSVVCASCRADDWWFWWSIWCWRSWSRIWCISLLFSAALWFSWDCCCCGCCDEELFALLSLLSVVMEDVSCWSSLSELQPSSLSCSAASIDFRCIPVQSRHIFILKGDKCELAVRGRRHYGVAAHRTEQVWRSLQEIALCMKLCYIWNTGPVTNVLLLARHLVYSFRVSHLGLY